MKGDSIIRALGLDSASWECWSLCIAATFCESCRPHREVHKEFVVLYKIHTSAISSQKAVPWDLLSELCQGRSDQRDSALCKQPSTVPFFAVSYLEICSIEPVLSSARIQPEAQSTGVPGNFSNPAQHKMHQAEIEWVYFWKHWLVLF